MQRDIWIFEFDIHHQQIVVNSFALAMQVIERMLDEERSRWTIRNIDEVVRYPVLNFSKMASDEFSMDLPVSPRKRPPLPRIKSEPSRSSSTHVAVATDMAEPSGRDRRRHPRIDLQLKAKVSMNGLTYIRQSVNVSQGGLLLDDEIPCPPQGSVRIVLVRNGEEIELRAQGVDGPHRGKAYAFQNADMTSQRLLETWIDDHVSMQCAA